MHWFLFLEGSSKITVIVPATVGNDRFGDHSRINNDGLQMEKKTIVFYLMTRLDRGGARA